MSLRELTCPRCGGELANNGNNYKCNCCGKAFEKEQTINVADEMRKVLDEHKQEMVANSRRQLWSEMHEKFIHSEKIISLAREIKKYLPEDYFACFAEVANNGSVKQVNDFLNNTTKEDVRDYADVVLDFMLKTPQEGNLTAISLFIERAFKGDTVNYDKYVTLYEKEAEKAKKGIYELILTRDVFLAYSSKDIDKVIELCDYLESQNISCFMALRNLRHGRGAVDNYDQALRTAIDNCKTVVFVSSTNSRSLSCDALTKELPYIKQKDLEHAPTEFIRAYDKLPQEYMLPRVEYLIEDYCGDISEHITKEFFHSLEWCKNKQAVAKRITEYLTAELAETSRQRAERENRELQQKLAEEQRKREQENLALQAKLLEEQRKLEELRAKNAENAKKGVESSIVAPQSQQKDGKYCKKCKTQNKPTAKFCAKCGSTEFFASFEEYEASLYKYCLSCGSKNDTENAFCEECGNKQFLPTYAEYTAHIERIRKQEEEKRLAEAAERARKAKEEAERRERLAREKKEREEREAKLRAEGKYTTYVNFDDKVTTYYDDKVTVLTPIAKRGIEKVIIGDGIKKIDVECFKGCNNLEEIFIPKSVKEMGWSVFVDCRCLKRIFVEYGRRPTTWHVNWLGAGAEKCKAQVIWGVTRDLAQNYDAEQKRLAEEAKRKAEEERLREAEEERIRKQKQAEEESIRKEEEAERLRIMQEEAQKARVYGEFNIENGVLKKFTAGTKTEAVIPDGVNGIGSNAFKGCSRLLKVTIPDSVTYIGDGAFDGCSNLKSVNIPNGVTAIGYDTFTSCRSLENVTIPDSVVSIGNSAFSFSGLKNITLPNSVTSIGVKAFYQCAHLESVILPDGISCINKDTFLGCNRLRSVVIPDGVKTIGDYAFSGCTYLSNVTIPKSVTEIKRRAFNYCGLNSILIPDSVIFVGEGVFDLCDRLKTIYCETKKPFMALPKGWDKAWLGNDRDRCRAKVIWEYKG